MSKVSLVVPMAGRGSRFASDGIGCPKPLLGLWGKPFFWWATESARRAFDIGTMSFVVRREHVENFAIDQRVLEFYPTAEIVVLDEVTNGAAETAHRAIEIMDHDGPILVNDSDHAFAVPDGSSLVRLMTDGVAGVLLSFQSSNPAYSYVKRDQSGRVTGTVEKQVVSDCAIAGAYLFADRRTFLDAYAGYLGKCRYNEVYVSGLFDRLLDVGKIVAHQPLEAHISFGTPSELAQLEASAAGPFWQSWQ